MTDSAGRQAGTVREQALGDDLSLFDEATGVAVALNRTARDVWELVDGRASVADITHRLAEAYGVDPDAIGEDVRRALEELRSAGVVVPDGP